MLPKHVAIPECQKSAVERKTSRFRHLETTIEKGMRGHLVNRPGELQPSQRRSAPVCAASFAPARNPAFLSKIFTFSFKIAARQ